jgi:drug/metabolite transporter (DMT)-like permease
MKDEVSPQPSSFILHPLTSTPLVWAVLLLVDSLHFVFARSLLPHLPPETSALLVLGVGTIETAVFLGLRREIRPAVFRQYVWFFLAIGFLIATSTVINYTAVAFVDPGTASLLGKTSVLFSLGMGILWLGDRLRRNQVLGIVLAVAGVFMISFQPGDYLRLGSLLVLLSTFLYTLHTAVVKRYGDDIQFANFFLFRVATTTAFLLLLAVGRSQLVWPGAMGWVLVILAGTVDVVISRVLYYLALRRMTMSIHAVILTLSPVITILWSLILFGERPGWLGIVGGAAVIAGVLLVTLGRSSVFGRTPPDRSSQS